MSMDLPLEDREEESQVSLAMGGFNTSFFSRQERSKSLLSMIGADTRQAKRPGVFNPCRRFQTGDLTDDNLGELLNPGFWCSCDAGVGLHCACNVIVRFGFLGVKVSA